MNGKIVKTWWFPSSSNPSKDYETLKYSDGTTSCNCKGWTLGGKRLDANGNRTCKHTRMVDAGMADQEAKRCVEYSKTSQTNQTVSSQKSSTVLKKVSKIKLEAIPARKISW